MALETRQFNFANFARSTLETDLPASASQLSVQPGHGLRFPLASVAGEQVFTCVLTSPETGGYEIVYVTAKSGDTFTVERGKEDTTPFPFPAGSQVVHTVTAGVVEQLAASGVPPTTPFLTGLRDDTDHHLEWTESEPTVLGISIVSYELYRSVDGGTFTLLATTDAADPREYDDDGLLYGHTYRYTVRAIPDLGPNSDDSNVVVAIPSLLVAVDRSGNGGVIRSSDGGTTWVGFTSLPFTVDIETGVTFSPKLNRLLAYCSNPTVDTDNFAYSDDYGETWTPSAKSDGLVLGGCDWVPWLELFVAGSSVVAGSMHVYTSPTGEDGTWTKSVITGNGTTGTFVPLFSVPSLGVIFAGTGNRTATSLNATAWSDNGFNIGQLRPEYPCYTRQNYSPELGYACLAGTGNGHIYKHPMIGAPSDTGVAAPGGATNTPLVWSPALSAFLTVDQLGFMKSTDGGDTWDDVTPPGNGGSIGPTSIPSRALCWSHVYERFVVVADVSGLGDGRVAYSEDGEADSWVMQSTPLPTMDWNYILAIEGDAP